MELKQILKQQADYTRNSDVVVEIDKRLPWVNITADEESNVFLQGHEAEEFLAKCDEYSEACQDMGMEEVQLAVAYRYLDILL